MQILRILPLILIMALLPPPAARGESRKITNLCSVVHPGDALVPWDCRKIKKGETAETLFGERWLDILRFNRIDRRHLVAGVSIKVPRDLEDIEEYSPLPDTYPKAAADEKFILVDLFEQFLGAYEYGELAFSFPIATGNRVHRTPTGDFRINGFSRRHQSSLYKIEKTDTFYPMHYALRFFSNDKGVDFWLHGRDLPGFPASHGCVGLSDEEMQRKYYHFSRPAQLQDSRLLYEWVVGDRKDSGSFTWLKNGPRVKIIGESPL
jgi:hypothetical protein